MVFLRVFVYILAGGLQSRAINYQGAPHFTGWFETEQQCHTTAIFAGKRNLIFCGNFSGNSRPKHCNFSAVNSFSHSKVNGNSKL